jgi:L-ascorbate metabolism protein UlaG (beta-lactamase superfamily)
VPEADCVALVVRSPGGAREDPFTAVHVDHSSELLWHNPTADKDETHVGGEPVGYIIELENGFKIYHMADTSVT